MNNVLSLRHPRLKDPGRFERTMASSLDLPVVSEVQSCKVRYVSGSRSSFDLRQFSLPSASHLLALSPFVIYLIKRFSTLQNVRTSYFPRGCATQTGTLSTEYLKHRADTTVELPNICFESPNTRRNDRDTVDRPSCCCRHRCLRLQLSRQPAQYSR